MLVEKEPYVTWYQPRARMEQFDESRFTDKSLLELVAKVTVNRSAELNRLYPEGIPNRITIQSKSGVQHVREVTFPRGHAKNPMTDYDVVRKFRNLAEPHLEESIISQVVERVWNLEKETDIGGLLKLFAVE